MACLGAFYFALTQLQSACIMSMIMKNRDLSLNQLSDQDHGTQANSPKAQVKKNHENMVMTKWN